MDGKHVKSWMSKLPQEDAWSANGRRQGDMMMGEKMLTEEGYKPRLIELRLDASMGAFGCVEINGP